MEYYEKTINNNSNKLYIFEKVIKQQIKKKNEKFNFSASAAVQINQNGR